MPKDIPEIVEMEASMRIKLADGKEYTMNTSLNDYEGNQVEALVDKILEFLADLMGPPPEAREATKHAGM